MEHKPRTWQSSLYGFSLTMTRKQAQSASGAGDQTESVTTLCREPTIAAQLDRLDPEAIRKELRESGAWDAAELADDSANRARLIWIVACDLREEMRT
jgi:hypothetical protein